MAHHNAVNLSASHLKTIALLPFLRILLTFSRFSANKMASCFSASSGDFACRYVKGTKTASSVAVTTSMTMTAFSGSRTTYSTTCTEAKSLITSVVDQPRHVVGSVHNPLRLNLKPRLALLGHGWNLRNLICESSLCNCSTVNVFCSRCPSDTW